MKVFIKRARKAAGALLGSATAAGLVAAAEAFGVDVSMELAGALAILAATVGAYIAPKNVEPTDD